MIVLHDYPLSIVDHAGFRRFVHALQPLFKMHTRNTIRKDIIGRYDKEKLKAIEYMSMLQSRVAVTTDMWTADNQKKGYMAVTGHFIDESWKLRSILMGFIYVPAPHTGDVIAEELHETLMQWNLDEKLLTVTVDNCTSNDKAVDLMISKIGKSKPLLQAQQKPAAARLQGEIEHYLSDDVVPYTETFNVLDWWKVAGTRYPTLRKVAKDIFAIPITSVASESAFSTSGRIVNEHRSRLTSHMLEMLIWVNKASGLVFKTYKKRIQR
ncbi:zinc finger BED domain-containing protein RICESLEEPER 2-like [Lolium rigidum]|uniref:zinc finger BED domain-containing protein RICESLEEPER 2-like n=1 Tax=Lolium rigidum TaxID=89674 RepID=UPI001F5D59FB|nr:zinc finger BED domain-containing protein RICESLEEPER 2-like [Lolium rigidum]